MAWRALLLGAIFAVFLAFSFYKVNIPILNRNISEELITESRDFVQQLELTMEECAKLSKATECKESKLFDNCLESAW